MGVGGAGMKPQVCAGFDGSTTDDWTVIRSETLDGHQFTPTYGQGQRSTMWDPGDFGGRIPRTEVQAAVDELFTRNDVARLYCDPRDWQTEIDEWALTYGEKVVIVWPTNRITQMHASLERFVTDLTTGRLTHDGCEVTARHIGNTRKLLRPGEKYIIGKPQGAYHQKIDAAVASVLAHEAACDARAAGWSVKKKSYVYTD